MSEVFIAISSALVWLAVLELAALYMHPKIKKCRCGLHRKAEFPTAVVVREE